MPKKYLDPIVCKIPKAHEERALNKELDSSANGTWRIFRIMAEFVSGFHFIGRLEKTVTVFGSGRLGSDQHYYKEAQKFGYLAGQAGFQIVTGGGPGIMEAANKGDYEANGDSIGLNIQLPFAQRMNKYVTEGIGFHYFFTRKVMLSAASQAYVFFPGGFGTLDELTEIITLIQTQKMEPIPVVLVGRDFWQPFLDWINSVVVSEFKCVDAADQKIYQLVNTAEEAFKIVKKSKPRQAF